MDNDIIPINQLPKDDVIPVNQLPNAEQPKQQTSLGDKLLANGVGSSIGVGGLGVAAGGAYGASKLYDFLRQPQVRKDLGGIKEQLKGIQQQIPSSAGQSSIEGTESSFIPKKLGQISQNLKQQLNAFDETLVSLKAKDLSENIKTNFSSWIKGATDTYGQGLDQLDTHFNKIGKSFNNQDFINQILDKTINQSKNKGVLDTDLASLFKLKQSLSNEYSTNIVPFSQAKGMVSGLVNENPYSATSGMLRENWGSFLEQNAPEEISNKLKEMNGQYKTFSQARTQLSRVADSKTGEFNTSKLNNYLIKYTKQRTDEGIVDLMKLLGEGSELTQPIKGVTEKFKGLSELKSKRFSNEDMIKQQIEKVNNLKSKSEELISRGNVLGEKLDSRNAGKIIAKVFGLGKKMGGLLSVVPQITGAIEFSQDPEAWFMKNEGGIDEPAKKGSLEREVQAGRIL